MPISVQRAPVPPKSSPSRSGALRNALMELTPDSEEAVMLHPDEASGLTLNKLRNRASGIISNLRGDGYFYLTRTTQAKRVNPETGKAEGEPEDCVGIWRLGTDPREGVAKPSKTEPAHTDEPQQAPSPDPSAKPANPKATSGAAGKADTKASGKAKADTSSGAGKAEPHPLEG